MCSTILFAEDLPASASRLNLAADASYSCAVRPNYWGWKNPQHGDQGQLTDGVIVEAWSTDTGPVYRLASSMGWTNMPPVIVFDLGRTCTIEGIGLHSVLSPWGPWWPAAIAVLVSDDNQEFYLAGPTWEPDVASPDGQFEPPLQEGAVQAAIARVMDRRGFQPSTHWLRSDGLQAQGRYVSLIMSLPPDTGSIVLDEIEIYGHVGGARSAKRGPPVFREGDGGWKSYQLHRAIGQRWSRDAAQLEHNVQKAVLPDKRRTELLQQLRGLQPSRDSEPVPHSADFRAILPVDALHARLFALNAALWRAQGAAELRVWSAHRWDPLPPLAQPQGDTPSIEMSMAQNAVRSAVINLSNAGDSTAEVRLNLTRNEFPANSVTLLQVPLVDTTSFEPVSAALLPLPRQGADYLCSIPAGMTRQVWLRLASRQLDEGTYTAEVKVSAPAPFLWSADVPLSVQVYPVRLPDRLSAFVGGWDYPFADTYQVTENNLADYVMTLREYGVNTTWAANPFPLGTFDGKGNLVTPPSRTVAGQWLQRWPDAKLYCAVLFELLPLDAPQRHEKYKAWAQDWSQYLQGRGVAPDQVAFLIRDEPTSEAELAVILETGRAIQEGEPRFKIWNDLHFPDLNRAPANTDTVMREACDIQCFNVQHYLAQPTAYQAFMEKYRRPGLMWWTYTGGGSHRLTDPYVAWQLRFWFCHDQQLRGAHFWAFGDGNGGFGWNEYLNAGPSRSPFYLSADTVVPSKSLEAMREGAQDYELLQMLRAHLLRANDAPALRQLQRDVQHVLSAHRLALWSWHEAKDRSTADQVRKKVLRQLSD